MTGIPHDLEAEEATLGAMMLSPRAIEQVADLGVTRQMFYRPSHQHVWDAIMALRDRDTVDELTVDRWLRSQGVAELVGGVSALMTLTERVPAVANVRAYAEAVRDSAARRGVLLAAQALAELAQDDEADVASLGDTARATVDATLDANTSTDIAHTTTLADAAMRAYEALAERAERGGTMTGVSTGLQALDARWGGLQPGRLYVIAGRPGMGKSALASGILEAVTFGTGTHTLAFNLEMPTEEQGTRTLARVGSVDLHRLSNSIPTEHDFEAMYSLMSGFHEAARRMHLDESSALTVEQIRARTRRLHRRLLRQHGEGLSAVLVDYLQLVTPPRGSKEHEGITYISRNLKSLALELKIPVIALSQLNRELEKRDDKRPTMADLRGSGSIEQDADVICLLYRDEVYEEERTPAALRGVADANTAKIRGGVPGRDKLRWRGAFVRFENYREEFNAGIDRGIA